MRHVFKFLFLCKNYDNFFPVMSVYNICKSKTPVLKFKTQRSIFFKGYVKLSCEIYFDK